LSKLASPLWPVRTQRSPSYYFHPHIPFFFLFLKCSLPTFSDSSLAPPDLPRLPLYTPQLRIALPFSPARGQDPKVFIAFPGTFSWVLLSYHVPHLFSSSRFFLVCAFGVQARFLSHKLFTLPSPPTKEFGFLCTLCSAVHHFVFCRSKGRGKDYFFLPSTALTKHKSSQLLFCDSLNYSVEPPFSLKPPATNPFFGVHKLSGFVRK